MEHKCKNCKDKGYTEYYPLDGMTIYSWQKPEKKACQYCEEGRRYEFKWRK